MSTQPPLDRDVVATVQRDVLVVTGPEAASYLQGQISAEVEALEVGQSALSFLLDPRGRVETLFVISRVAPETFVLDTDAGFGEAMTASLERFKLRTKAEFSLAEWTMHAVRSSRAPHVVVIGVPFDALHAEKVVRPAHVPLTSGALQLETVVRPAHWPLTIGYDTLMSPYSIHNDMVPRGERVSAGEFEALRMAYGLPAMGTEIQPGDIPNETGLVERAASFTKGCYRGQELVERIDSRAGGRRSIRRVRAAGELSTGEELRAADGAVIGNVLSAARLDDVTVGFASVRRDAEGNLSSDGGQLVELTDLF